MALKPFTPKQLRRIYFANGAFLLVATLVISGKDAWPTIIMSLLAGWLLGWSTA